MLALLPEAAFHAAIHNRVDDPCDGEDPSNKGANARDSAQQPRTPVLSQLDLLPADVVSEIHAWQRAGPRVPTSPRTMRASRALSHALFRATLSIAHARASCGHPDVYICRAASLRLSWAFTGGLASCFAPMLAPGASSSPMQVAHVLRDREEGRIGDLARERAVSTRNHLQQVPDL